MSNQRNYDNILQLRRFGFQSVMAVILLFIISMQPVWGQSEQEQRKTILSDRAPSLRFENLGMADGLAQKSVQDIMQDSLGYIWMATQGGLHRYNGYEFEVFQTTPFDSTSISSNYTFQIEESANGNIWVSTANGLNRYNRKSGTFTTFKHDPQDSTSISDNITRALLEDSEGNLWVGTENSGLNRLAAGEQNKFERFQYDPQDPNTISSNTVMSLSEDSNGNIWVGTLNGLNKIDPQTDKVTRYLYDSDLQSNSATSPNFIRDIYPSQRNSDIVWAASGQGLVRLNYTTGDYKRYYVKPTTDGKNLSANLFMDIESDPNRPGVLWVTGSSEGLARFSIQKEEFSLYSHKAGDPNSIAANGTDNILTDRSGKMWVGHFNSGVSSFNPKSMDFRHFRNEPSNPKSKIPGVVWGIYEDNQQTLWAVSGVGESTVTALDLLTGNVRHYEHDANESQTILSGRAVTITGTPDGSIWVGGFTGLNKLDRNTGNVTRIQHKPIDQNTSRNFIFYIQQSTDGKYLWIGHADGIDRYEVETGKFTPIQFRSDEFDAPRVFTMTIDSKNRVWAGTELGLWRVYPDNHAELISNYDSNDRSSISSNFITTIYQRKSEPDILWIGTGNGGLNRFDISTGRVTQHYTKTGGLPDNTVYGILEDNNGTLWMSTNQGISNFDPDTDIFRNYGLSAGLRSLEFSQNGFEKGGNGVLYFGSDAGITAFRPEDLDKNAKPPQVVISDFKIFNESVAPGPESPLRTNIENTDQITVNYDQNEFSFEYVALHYANPEKNEYQYRLEGYDQEWVDAGTRRTASYTNLEPGSYTFKVIAANSDGVWNKKGASVKLTVLPPWYRTWWAYGIFAVMIGFAGFGLDRFQRNRVRKKERERSELREAELRAEEENKRREDTEQLSKIGRAVTSSLAVEEIIETIYKNVNDLMDAAVFGVGIYNAEQERLEFPATKEKGQTLPPYHYELKEENRLANYCFTHGEEVLIRDYAEEHGQYINTYVPPVEGDDTVSVVYLPLVYQNEIIGVLTTQSFERNAYSDYQLNLLRNLATYAAIAIDNAAAYRRLNKTLEDLREAQEQLVQQEKLASLGQLTAGIAHEIKNPLNFVNNFSDLTLELLEEARGELGELETQPDEVYEILDLMESNLKKIHQHGSRADGIVKSMLQHSRGGNNEKAPIELNEIVDEYVKLSFHGMRAGKDPINVDIQTELGEDVGEVSLIAEDFSRVIVNLCNNAFDAMREKVDQTDDYQPQLTIQTRKDNGSVEVDIRDNGPGIPEEIQQQILQPFFTTKQGTEGTGLGLSITNDIIKAHGGSIDIESEPGEYTIFKISLPRN
jgi:signal transduction histidine kinase/ligand-binding sensor domain-containing protein